MDIDVTDEEMPMAQTIGAGNDNAFLINQELLADIPKDSKDVVERLRLLGYPTSITGEDEEGRYRRLEIIILQLREKCSLETRDKTAAAETHTEELWYHEGCDELLHARMMIAFYSLTRYAIVMNCVQARLENEVEFEKKTEFEKAAKSQDVQRRFGIFEYRSSQLGDNRPLTFCQVSPHGDSLATASRSGICKLWNIKTGQLIRSFEGHHEHAGSIVFHPELYNSESDTVIQLASCCAEGSIFLWNIKKNLPIVTLPSVEHRVSRAIFHPSGEFLASACFDKSWRLFDLEKNIEILRQEGHSRECYNIAFHPDGSLIASTFAII
ncbi:U4/U6 small nuclear ribonucleoprotein Prp4 [Thelohanellus kitauei]|uniref:U4/U6 small nuclear ribonucleoprotein Prp4 n=1 Tax=Thelohanellus kitauei TaxID=669202 RepID=A0A0C2IV55_THEKT|nr:U4/U6 small nuclear ribonucleoprotein Prp4 [Thelohanellus kitauei]